MAGSEDASLRVVGEDSAAAEAAGEPVVDLRQQVLDSQGHVISLEQQLAKAIELETDAARQLDLRRTYRVAVDQQLHDAREEAARLMVEEASQKRDATVAGAVAEAEIEVNRITMEGVITAATYEYMRQALEQSESERIPIQPNACMVARVAPLDRCSDGSADMRGAVLPLSAKHNNNKRMNDGRQK